MAVRFDPILNKLLTKYVKTSGDTMTGDLVMDDANISLEGSGTPSEGGTPISPYLHTDVSGYGNHFVMYQRGNTVQLTIAASETQDRTKALFSLTTTSVDFGRIGSIPFRPYNDSTNDFGETSKRWKKGWFDDVESTNMYTVGGTSIQTTFDGRYVNVTGDTMTGDLEVKDARIDMTTAAATETEPIRFAAAGQTPFNIYQRTTTLTVGTGSGTTNRALGIKLVSASGTLLMYGSAAEIYPDNAGGTAKIGRTTARFAVAASTIDTSGAGTHTGTHTITVPTTTNEALILKTSDDNTTKNIFEVQDSSGNVLANVTAAGAGLFTSPDNTSALTTAFTVQDYDRASNLFTIKSLESASDNRTGFFLEAPVADKCAYTIMYTSPGLTGSYLAFGINRDESNTNGLGVGFTNRAFIQSAQNSGQNKPIYIGVNWGTGIYVATDNDIGINEASPGAQLHVTNSTAADVGLLVKGAASQSANLLEIQNSAGGQIAWIADTGAGVFGGTGNSTFDDTKNMGIYSRVGGLTNGQIVQAVTGVSTETSGTMYGARYVMQSAPSGNGTAVIYGLDLSASAQNGNNLTTVIGGRFITFVKGAQTPTVTELISGQFTCDAEDATLVTRAISTNVDMPDVDTGTITDAYGMRIVSPTIGAGNTVNQYGIYIQAISGADTINAALVTNAGAVVFNEDGSDSDFRIEGNTDANLLFVDASTDRVGIGTATPSAFLGLKAPTTVAASLNFPAGASPTTPVAGDVWNDSTQLTLMNFTSGIKQYMGGSIFVQTDDATVANTTTETTLVGTGLGTTTLPTDFFVAGRAFRITATGFYSTRHDVTTLTIKVKLGSTVILTTVAEEPAVDVVDKSWTIPLVDITCRSTGATGTVMANGHVYFATVAKSAPIDQFTPNTTAVTIDTTTTQAITVTATWGHADASNTITCTNLAIQSLN